MGGQEMFFRCAKRAPRRAAKSGARGENDVMRYWSLQVVVAAIIGVLLLAPPAFADTVYSDDAVWDWSAHANDMARVCGVTEWFALHPGDRVHDTGCVVAAMRQQGASD